MSATDITDAVCSGKRSFRSYAEAAKAASKTARTKGGSYQPYKCPVCGAYHYGCITRDRKAPFKKRRPRNEEDDYGHYF